jgi:hypothetical protein
MVPDVFIAGEQGEVRKEGEKVGEGLNREIVGNSCIFVFLFFFPVTVICFFLCVHIKWWKRRFAFRCLLFSFDHLTSVFFHSKQLNTFPD